MPPWPQVQKGALVVYDSNDYGTQPSRRIVFQYNPETLRRSFAVRAPQRDASQAGAAHEDVLSVPGPPVETITMSVELVAADQLDDPQHRDQVDSDGLYGALAALELLLYPASAQVSRIEQQADQGAVDVHQADTPLVVLCWGQNRAVPVQLMSLSVNEELFDPMLNPIVAKVDLSLKVLTYMEFTRQSVGRETFIAHQKKLENLAQRWVGG
jgi:hypothetical protein